MQGRKDYKENIKTLVQDWARENKHQENIHVKAYLKAIDPSDNKTLDGVIAATRTLFAELLEELNAIVTEKKAKESLKQMGEAVVTSLNSEIQHAQSSQRPLGESVYAPGQDENPLPAMDIGKLNASVAGLNALIKSIGQDEDLRDVAVGNKNTNEQDRRDHAAQLFENEQKEQVAEQERTRFFEAIGSNTQKSIAQALEMLEKNPTLAKITNKNNQTPLLLATFLGNKEVMRALIDAGAECNATSDPNTGGTPLHIAVAKGDKEVVEILIKGGAHLNLKIITTGDTPLHIAVAKGHTEVVKELIAKRADVNAKNKAGQTPLDYLKNQTSINEDVKVAIADLLKAAMAKAQTVPSAPSTGPEPAKVSPSGKPTLDFDAKWRAAQRLHQENNPAPQPKNPSTDPRSPQKEALRESEAVRDNVNKGFSTGEPEGLPPGLMGSTAANVASATTGLTLEDFMREGSRDKSAETQSEVIFKALRDKLGNDTKKKIGLLYSANNEQAMKLQKARDLGDEIPEDAIPKGATGQGAVFRALIDKINKANLHDQIQIYPIATSMHGGDNVRGNQVGKHHVDRDLLAIAGAINDDVEMIGTPEVVNEANTGFVAIGGLRSSKWKTDTEVKGFEGAAHEGRTPKTQDAYVQKYLKQMREATTAAEKQAIRDDLMKAYDANIHSGLTKQHSDQQTSKMGFRARAREYFRRHPVKAGFAIAGMVVGVLAAVAAGVAAAVFSGGLAIPFLAGAVAAVGTSTAAAVGISAPFGFVALAGLGIGGAFMAGGIRGAKDESARDLRQMFSEDGKAAFNTKIQAASRTGEGQPALVHAKPDPRPAADAGVVRGPVPTPPAPALSSGTGKGFGSTAFTETGFHGGDPVAAVDSLRRSQTNELPATSPQTGHYVQITRPHSNEEAAVEAGKLNRANQWAKEVIAADSSNVTPEEKTYAKALQALNEAVDGADASNMTAAKTAFEAAHDSLPIATKMSVIVSEGYNAVLKNAESKLSDITPDRATTPTHGK